MQKNYYEIIGVAKTAKREEILAAAKARNELLKEAAQVLCDPAKRRAFDAELAKYEQQRQAVEPAPPMSEPTLAGWQLEPGETLLYRVGLHPRVYLLPSLLCAAALGLALFPSPLLPLPQWPAWQAPAILGGLGLLSGLYAWLRWHFTELRLTSRRVLLRWWNWRGRNRLNLTMHQIKRLEMVSGLWGKALGYATLHLESDENLRRISGFAKPAEMQRRYTLAREEFDRRLWTGRI